MEQDEQSEARQSEKAFKKKKSNMSNGGPVPQYSFMSSNAPIHLNCIFATCRLQLLL